MSLFILGDFAIYTSYCQHQKNLITAGSRCDHTATQQQERGSRVHKSSENRFPQRSHESAAITVKGRMHCPPASQKPELQH